MKKYTIGLYEKAMPQACSWQEKLIFAKATGFDFVEMSIDETDEKLARLEMTEEERQSLVQEFDRTGISVRSICLSAHRKYPLGSSDPQLAARSIGILCQAVQLADDLGVRIIQLAGYDVYYEDSTPETRQRFLENLRQIVQIAASKSVILGFETMETAFMNTVEKSMQYVEALASPYLGVYPDIGNLTNAAALYGTDVQCDMRLGKGSIVAMHLKETLPGVFREVPFGSGHVQFADALQTAWSLGVRRFVIEMWDVGKDSWQQDIRQAFTQVDGLLQQVGNKGQENEYEQHL